MQLEGDPEGPRLLTRGDHTERLREWAARRVREMEKENLGGFIFKSRSPSCGLEGVRVYGDKNTVRNNGAGIFARAFVAHFPGLPVVENDRLHDTQCELENFLERLMVYRG